MDACLDCGAPVETPELSQVVCSNCHSKSHGGVDSTLPVDPVAGVGLGFAALPFVFSVRATESSSISGPGFEAVSSHTTDYVALGCGALAAIFAVVALLRAFGMRGGQRNVRLATAAVLFVLASFQFARGAGVV